jgi:hypothetical protein
MMRFTLFTAVAVAAVVSTSATRAEVINFTATLNGASETPANPSAGKGTASVALDTDAKRVTWTITYSGLTGPATMAHFHGPAPVGVAAGVLVPVTGDLTSPIKGSAEVDDGQIGDLRGGLWYVNVHTAQYPKGEIRGQLSQATK